MEICEPNKCSGYYACTAICPQHCITMQDDEYGELHPVVDESKCIHCNLCKTSCPQNKKPDYNYPKECYASWITDNEKRRICASGGIATLLSEYVITRKNGVVFGSRYSSSMEPIMTYTDHLEELEYFKGSRYVQSIIGYDTFKQVKAFLKEGRFVLFIGTPCQIAGLMSYLKHDYDNLITIDLICHGVNPTSYFKQEIKHLCSQNKILNPTDVRFRGNDGKNFRLTIWNKKGECQYERRAYEQHYFAGFMLGVTLRENCYQCPHARPERIGDITLGDFIGLGNKVPFPFRKENVSSITLNTEKGSLFYKQASECTPDIKNVLRNYAERLEYAPSLRHPYKRHPLNIKFRKQVATKGYINASRTTLDFEIFKNITRRIVYQYKKKLKDQLKTILHNSSPKES